MKPSLAENLVVVGCGVEPGNITREMDAIVNSADVLAGGSRLLKWFPNFSGERMIIGADAAATAREIVRLSSVKKVVVLASGDGLFFGIASLLSRLSNGCLRIIPNITAMQAAMSRLGLTWEDARFFSLHGANRGASYDALVSDKAVIYGDPSRTASDIALALMNIFPRCAGRPAAVAQNLGLKDEMVFRGSIEEISRSAPMELSMLILLPADSSDGVFDPGIGLGRPDDAYARNDGLITHPEVRAAILSKLKLGPGVMWDLGAGSGSVAIEASGLARGLKVYAVESSSERCNHIKDNAAKYSSSVNIINDDIINVMQNLPRPRAVFVGGGGKNCSGIVMSAFDRLLPGGRLVAIAVMLETKAALTAVMPDRCVEVVDISVARSRPVGQGRLMESRNSVEIFIYEKETE